MNAERTARIFVIGLIIGLPLALFSARLLPLNRGIRGIELHARMPESGGWSPADLTARVGEPLHLRLTSDDVIHSFAIGQSDEPPIDIYPGQVVETTLMFDKPGKYVYYCTRWCGANHWRMRGTIEVSGGSGVPEEEKTPLFAQLGIDIDAPHPAEVLPERRPSAARGAALGVVIPDAYLSLEYLRSHSPVQAWQDLRAESFSRGLSDGQVWDLVALLWKTATTPEALEEARQFYARNCAACHGENGSGDGVMADSLTAESDSHAKTEHATKPPVDFRQAASMLGASPALLQGKIVRGGMGTGMPYWGPVLTEEQTWALVGYLWTFQFDFE
jgi:mono/diheme cytochrome c family protein